MKEVSNEISLDEDESTAVLLLSVTNKSETDTSKSDTSKNDSSKNDSSKNDSSKNDSSKSDLENSVTKTLERPEALEIDESVFKRPRKSVLKPSVSPTVSYTSSPSFPTDESDRRRSNGRDCCIVM